MRLAFAYVFAFLPMPLKRLVARWVYRWDLHPTAYIGPSVLTVRRLSMGPGSAIGGRNTITNVNELRLGEGATIGSGNMVKGWWDHPDAAAARPRPLSAAGGSCADCVVPLHRLRRHAGAGPHAAIAGFRSTVLTHSIDLVRDKYVAGPVILGDHAVVMSGCMLLAGTRVPPRSIVAAGSVVDTKLSGELTLYRGNPAIAVRELPERLKFFQRGRTSVSTDRLTRPVP